MPTPGGTEASACWRPGRSSHPPGLVSTELPWLNTGIEPRIVLEIRRLVVIVTGDLY
jgi:hypothetical protein